MDGLIILESLQKKKIHRYLNNFPGIKKVENEVKQTSMF